MKAEIIDKAIELRKTLNFAQNQIGAVEELQKTLKNRPEMASNARIDLHYYMLHSAQNIPIGSFAVPPTLVDFEEVINYWECVKAEALRNLETL
jgi:hypothetical protein